MQKYAMAYFYDIEGKILFTQTKLPYSGNFEDFKEMIFKFYQKCYIVDTYEENDTFITFAYMSFYRQPPIPMKIRIEVIN